METIKIPYGDSFLELVVKENMKIVKSAKETEMSYNGDSKKKIRRAIERPVQSKTLEELCKTKKNCVIVVDDQTRGTPTKLMVDVLVDTIEKYIQDIKILFATGTHRAPKDDEINRILGRDILKKVQIDHHNCDNLENLVFFGETSYKTPVYINKTYLSSDLKIITGDISLHYYAGFGGGRKSIVPGLAGRDTIKKNHSLLLDKNASMGNLKGNPVHLDMTEITKMYNKVYTIYPDFSLNIIAGSKGDIASAAAGDLNAVFDRLVKIAKKIMSIEIKDCFDSMIVSSGGYPRDINLYQAVKALEMVKYGVKPGGNIVLIAECREGIGDYTFEEWMKDCACLEEAEERIKQCFELGGHKAYYLRNILKRNKVYLLSNINEKIVKDWGMIPIKSLSEILNVLKDGTIGIIPSADFMIENKE